mgnify:CR=1 FL=1
MLAEATALQPAAPEVFALRLELARAEGRETGALTYTFADDGTNIRRINDKGQDACSYFFPDGKLSLASEALEISSRRKISRSL